MVFETSTAGLAFLLGRVLFGGVLGFMGLNHFSNVEDMAGYAEMKGILAPRAAVVVSGAILVVGGLSIILGVYPLVGAGVLVAFFVVTTPTMHDFWRVADPERAQQEQINFLKNAALLGGSLVFLTLSGTIWPYALDLHL